MLQTDFAVDQMHQSIEMLATRKIKGEIWHHSLTYDVGTVMAKGFIESKVSGRADGLVVCQHLVQE